MLKITGIGGGVKWLEEKVKIHLWTSVSAGHGGSSAGDGMLKSFCIFLLVSVMCTFIGGGHGPRDLMRDRATAQFRVGPELKPPHYGGLV